MLLVVRCASYSVGSTEPNRLVLASSPRIVRRYGSFRDGNRLRCQLAQESHSSLCYYRATILDCCCRLPAVRLDDDSRQQPSGLATRCYGSRYRDSTGFAVYATFCVLALKYHAWSL